jgi:hypothetical protein
MSIFDRIRDKIFARKPAPKPTPIPTRPAEAATRPEAAITRQTGTPLGTSQDPAVNPAAPASRLVAEPVDVEKVLLEMMEEKGNPHLNWRTSVADLMRLLDLDPSLENRKELARELGYSGATDGSAEMNIWLYKAVMQQLSANGGKVPASLAD